jgi:hypothetical protein
MEKGAGAGISRRVARFCNDTRQGYAKFAGQEEAQDL